MKAFFFLMYYIAIGRVVASGVPHIFGAATIFIRSGGRVRFGKQFKSREMLRLNVASNGKIIFGDKVFFNNGCSINSHQCVRIGNNVQFGENVVIYDHDHEFESSRGVVPGKFKTAPVVIGSNCWIGSNTVLLRGTEIGDGSVVGAGSVVRGSFPSGSKVVGRSVGSPFE